MSTLHPSYTNFEPLEDDDIKLLKPKIKYTLTEKQEEKKVYSKENTRLI